MSPAVLRVFSCTGRIVDCYFGVFSNGSFNRVDVDSYEELLSWFKSVYRVRGGVPEGVFLSEFL